MPLFARQPAMEVLETGEVIAVLSECSQRIRAKSLLLDPESQTQVLVCREAPQRNERLGWFFQTKENEVLSNPTVTPIFVLENNAKDGANPKIAHYLRDAQSLELTYFPTTKEVNVFFWWNLFSPTKSVPTQISCVPTHMVPTKAVINGDWVTYPDPDGTPLQAINKPVNQVMTFPLPWGPNKLPIAGLFGRKGFLLVTLGIDPTITPPPNGMTWKGLLVQIVIARREVPNSIRKKLNLPESTSDKPDGGDSPVNGPYRDGNPDAAIRISGSAQIGNETQSFEWEFNTGTTNPYALNLPSSGKSNALTIYFADVRFQNPHVETVVYLMLQVFIDNLYIAADSADGDGFSSFYIAAVDATLQCSNTQDGLVNTFYDAPTITPIVFTLPLDLNEPHAFQRTTQDVAFNYSVGDPPLDPGGGWAGIYNLANYNSLLSVGGASPGKDNDPFQFTDAHKSIPSDPGMVTFNLVREEAALINLEAIPNSLNAYTQHLYHQREIQASRMSTRTLMMAKGKIQILILNEDTPAEDDVVVSTFGGLTVGLSGLTPAVLNESYQGQNTVHIIDSITLFPFGVQLPGFVAPTPGEVGHQFKVSGGSSPYAWCLRRTKSSATDPAIEPVLPGPPSPPYPFDDHGELIPNTPFPPATQSGGLPPGMLINQDGILYGTPTQSGVFIFQVHVKDNSGLHGEETVRLVVLTDENEVPACSQSRVTPIVYKATITRITLPTVKNDPAAITAWKGKIEATGGQSGKYLFFFENPVDPPRQMYPVVGGVRILTLQMNSGDMTIAGLTPDNFEDFRGIWLFDLKATEVPVGNVVPTCDIRAVALAIGTTQVAGMADPEVITASSNIPEGAYQAQAPAMPYLVLDPPVPVMGFIQGKNVYLRGSAGMPLRPDLGGLHVNPGIVTSLVPGSVNPVQVIGIGVESSAPSHYHLDWIRSNPVSFFRDIVDRFDPVPVPPAPPLPPGLPPFSAIPPVEGASIDEMIPVGKRIRPLWPV